MRQSELADPYLTPRTLPARRPITYLVFGIILAVILMTVAAASLVVWRATRPMRWDLDRVSAIERRVEMDRGPIPHRIEQPTDSSVTIAAETPSP